MLKLERLNEALEKWDDSHKELPTIKETMIILLATPPGGGGEKALDCVDLALRLKRTKEDSLEIENADLKILNEVVKAPSMRVNMWGQGQIRMYLDKVK